MKPKTIKITYWVLTVLFCLFAIADGMAGALKEKTGVAIVVGQLGYPLYVLVMTGAAKAIGGLVLLQNKFKTLKEWAFAGFAIDFVGASISHAAMHTGVANIVSPLVFLIVLLVLHYFWKRYEAVKNVQPV